MYLYFIGNELFYRKEDGTPVNQNNVFVPRIFMDFGKRLKYLRIKNNISQKELAKLLNVGVSTISNYETGRNEPSYDKLIILAKYFNVSIDYLLGNSENKKPDESIKDDDIFEIKFRDIHKKVDKKTALEYFFKWLLNS